MVGDFDLDDMPSKYNNRCTRSTTMFVGTGNNDSCYCSNMETLADRLQRTMDAKGLNQRQLADEASARGQIVTQQSIQQILSGRNKTSKHLPSIADALNVELHWLLTGKGTSNRQAKVPVICYVGAGAEMHPIDDHPRGQGFDEVDPPQGIGNCIAAIIRGESMYPMKDGWLIFWSRDHQGVTDDCIGKLCVVEVMNGPTLVKEVLQGSKKGLYDLHSWNAPVRKDQRLAWAAKVMDIRPR